MKSRSVVLLETVFSYGAPLVRAPWLQRFLTQIIPLPYRFARHLKYRGVVSFLVAGVPLRMRSYNTPIEITIFWRGLYNGREGSELQAWSEIVSSNAVVLDIGANTGVYALVASALSKGAVHAFEPVPTVHKMLIDNIALSQRPLITAHQVVVSDTTNPTTLHVPVTSSGWTDIASLDAAFVSERTTAQQSITVPSITVDQFLRNQDIAPTTPIVCKIDVEGAELRVLQGMQETLQQRPVVLLVELLDTTAFAAAQALLPAQYACYPVDRQGIATTAVMTHQAGVKNYVITATR